MSKLLRTSDSSIALVVRVALGVVMFPHGAQKLLGWFGGNGPAGTIGFFQEQLGIPAPLTMLVIAAEFFGALGLIVGFLTRVAAFGILCNMIGAVLLVHLPNGFFMDWNGQLPVEGFEYHLLAIGMSLGLMIAGGGRASVDRAIAGGPYADGNQARLRTRTL